MRKLWALAPALVVAGFALWPSSTPTEVKGPPVDAADRIATISTGDNVDLARHLAAGRLTLFEYTAAW